MSQEIINVGATPNDGQGDPLRTAYIKCNNNFTELFATSALPPRIANGASSVNIPQGDGNILFTVNDFANVVVVTQNSVNVTGAISATGNLSGANISLSGQAVITGNVQSGNLRTTGLISATGNITGGNLGVAGRISGATYTGTSASFTGNVTGGNLLTTGAISTNGSITGTYLIGDGSQLTNITISNIGNLAVTEIANTSSKIFIASAGGVANIVVSGVPVATFASTGEYINGVLSVTGNARVGDLATAGAVSATANIVGGNFNTVGVLSSAGNVQAGNLRTAGLISAAGTITGASVVGGVITGSSLSVTGNVYSDNATFTGDSAANNISAAGTITGSTIIGTVLTGTISTADQPNITSVGTLTSLNSDAISSSGNITGANILTSGLISATSTITGGNLATSGTVSSTGNITGANIITSGLISATGNITGGNLSVGTGRISVGSIVNNNANGVGNIGTSTTYFNTVFAKATSAQYADLAEYYIADAAYEPGTVVKFGGEFEVTLADTDLDPSVAGVVSTSPAYAMNTDIKGTHTVAVALQGRVPTKVQGPVSKGQMMVSAGDGYARAETKPEIGTVIGKALENFDGDQGIIEVVVGRV